MKSISSPRSASTDWILSNLMFFSLMIGYASCARSSFALAADTEPMVSLAGGVPPQAPTLLAGADPASAGNLLQMRIYLELRDKAAARQMNEDLHNSASSNYHKWLNPQKFDEMFGPLQTTYDEISAWLQSQGFSVTAIRRDRRDIEFSGTVAQADQAFHVQILGMRDGKHYGITSDPMIPTRFQGLILGVMGLDNLSAVSPASTISPI